MGNELSWVIELAVKPGKLEEFKALRDEMVESTEKETGALQYEWFISEDGTAVQVLERYADSAAGLQHVGNFGAFAERFLGAVDVTRLTVYGEPDDELRGALSAFGPAHLSPFGGFAR